MLITNSKINARDFAEQRFRERTTFKPRSFLSVADLDPEEMKAVLYRGLQMKRYTTGTIPDMHDLSLALLFQKTSTRTRCSFENAAADLGMFSSYIDWRTSNFMLADLADEIVVLSRYYDVIVARVQTGDMLRVMAAHSEVPVINGMCDREHPCQTLTDLMTLMEYFGPDLAGLRLAYFGDGNNVCRSLALGAAALNIQMVICSPKGYCLDEETMAMAGKFVSFVDTPTDALHHADVIYTDTWISIGQEEETAERLAAFAPYQLNASLMETAPPHALIMHCLPAHIGQEITADLLRSARSIVFDQAENRLHAQKALLEWLITQNKQNACRIENIERCIHTTGEHP